MKIIRLEALKQCASIESNDNYFYDGQISDYGRYGEKIDKKYPGNNLDIKNSQNKDGLNKGYFLYPKNELGGRDFRISIARGFRRTSRIFLRGHEEAHLFQEIKGGMDKLEKILRKVGYHGKELIRFNDELSADVGGIYSLIVNLNIPLHNLRKWDEILYKIYSEEIYINNDSPLNFFLKNFAA